MKRRIRRVFQISLLVGIAATGTGCVGAVIGHAWDIGEDETRYREHVASLSRPKPGHGRLFIYVIDGGPYWPHPGIGPSMTGYIAVDDAVYPYLSESYYYLDIPEGPHKLWDLENRHFERGNMIEVSLRSGEEVYVRLDLSGLGIFTSRAFIVMDESVAQQEMLDLRMPKNSEMMPRDSRVYRDIPSQSHHPVEP